MKILESAPNRYDQGIRWLTGGRLGEVYDRLAGRIQPGQKVLDIGCGTGSLSIRAALKGARVKGMDINPQMLDLARKKSTSLPNPVTIEWVEMGVTELDTEPADSYDVVMSGLCFSELSEEERSYGLHEIYRILKPDGLLLLADEAESNRILLRILSGLSRIF
jgi:demethylmenaquinone methyltransferase/2-methoxy-6-polyprenyl-1,4-benzoquinol methylase